jgi:DNA-binding IclR family transcriptional regulator
MDNAIIDDDLDGDAKVLARGLTILRVFEPQNRWLSNREIGSLTSLPRTTVSRLTARLAVAGYLLQSPETAKYQLGDRVRDIGEAEVELSEADVVPAARPLLEEIAEFAPVSATTYKREGALLRCVDFLGAASGQESSEEAGSTLSLDSPGAGRLILAMLPQNEQAVALKKVERSGQGEAAASLHREIDDAAAQIARKGFCVRVGCGVKGRFNRVGVVMQLPMGAQWFAFELQGPGNLLPPDRFNYELGPALAQVKRKVMAILGI